MTKPDRRREESAITREVTRNDILRAFDSGPDPALSSAQLLAELSGDNAGLQVQLEKMREDGLVGRIPQASEGPEDSNEFVWWPTVAPRLSIEAVKRVIHAERLIEEEGTVPLEDSNGQLMENVRTTTAVRESLREYDSTLQNDLRRRIRAMDTDPESNLLRVYQRSEYVLKIQEYRAIVKWRQATYLFFLLDIGHRSQVYE